MASNELVRAWGEYKDYYNRKGVDEQLINACYAASKSAILGEKDIEYGLEITECTKSYIHELIHKQTGSDLKELEEWQERSGQKTAIVNTYYDILLLEARYVLDSYILYIEKNRPRKERFYAPRRRTLKQMTDKLQALENDELDELFIHQPARTGKSQLITLYSTWHCARDTEASNLYVTYKEGLGGAFLDGVQEIYTDPTYCFSEVFPDVRIVDTDAKNNKLDLNRKKKYKSLSGKGLESGLNGEYDAYGVLILDDILEGVQDVLSADVLRRKQIIFDNNVMMRKKQNCKVIYNGTIWATNDLYMDRLNFLETDKSAVNIRYDVIKIPALDPVTDESNFDYEYGVGYSTEYYRTLRAKFEMNDDLAGWFAQCQQEPIDRTGAVFNPEHMRYFSDLPAEEPIKVIGHCDTALGGGDFVSFPVIYYYEDGSGYVEDVVFDNSEKHITEPQVVAMIKKHDMRNVHFESNQGGEAYKEDVARMLLEDKNFNGGRPINITSSWAPVNKRKEQRIWDNAQDIRELYFKDPQHRHEQYRKFMQNLFTFSLNMKRHSHDDAADSLAGCVEFEKHGSGVRKATISRSWV